MAIVVVNTLSGYTNGTISTFNYTADLAAIVTALTTLNTSLNLQLGNINKSNETMWSPVGIGVTGTPIAVMAAQGKAINNMATMTASMMTSLEELNSNVRGIQVAIAAMTAHVANGVTTQQVALADQIKNNKFQQQTTNAALDRSGLPPTEVAPTELQTQITQTVSEVSPLKASIATAGLVEQGLGTAIAWTTTNMTNIIAESFIGSAAASAATTVKGWLNIKAPEVTAKAKISEASAAAAKAQLGGT